MMTPEELLTELQAALDVVDAAKRWQRKWERRRQHLGAFVTEEEEWLSRMLDAYQHRQTRYDTESDIEEAPVSTRLKR